MKTRKLQESFGAEVLDFDPAGVEVMEDSLRASFRELLYENELLLLRGQELGEEGLIALAKVFGRPVPFAIQTYRHAKFPEILITSNETREGKPLGVSRVGTFWHSDSSYNPNPPAVTVLQGRVIPQVGGDTFFVSMTDAYGRLPEDVRALIEGRDAVHTIRKRYKVAEQDLGRSIAELHEDLKVRHPDTVHPLVVTHPHTRKKALYFSEGYTLRINGLKPTEQQEAFDMLDAHCTRDESAYRHVWQPNDILIWDNRSLIHRATAAPQARTMFRVAVA